MALIATVVLVVACLGAGTYLLRKIVTLTEDGLRTEARVAAVERGAKNSKWPVYEFTTVMGFEVKARDITQLMFAPIELGDTVPVIYDPADPSVVTADLALWLWRGPAIFFSGAALVAGLGAAIWIYSRRRDPTVR